MKRRRLPQQLQPRWRNVSLAQQARAYLPEGVPFRDPYANGYPWHQGATSRSDQEEHPLATATATKATKDKVAAATSSAKQAKDAAEEPAVRKLLNDKELSQLIAAKDAETDPKERAALRRQVRAALKARGEFVPVADRPHKERKAAKAAAKAEAAPPVAPTKTKRSK